MKNSFKSNLVLLMTAVIWGGGLVAQKAGAVLQPFTYNGIRMFIGGLALIPVIYLLKVAGKDKSAGSSREVKRDEKEDKKNLLIGGICCGCFLCLATSLQQFGFYFETSAGKTGFITSLYIVIVPLLGLFLGKHVRTLIWVRILLGAFGFYLLTMAGKREGFRLSTGELYILLCVVAFSVHILAVDCFSPKCDGIRLSCVQFLTSGVIGIACMLIFETPVLSDILDCWLPILYCGVISTGVGYTGQVLGQKDTEPAVASLILSLEAVFSVIFGVLILKEHLTIIEGIGCAVIFAAVVIAQIPSQNKSI